MEAGPAMEGVDASDAKATLVIKSIIREIVAICAEEGHVVHDDLAAFMVKSVVLSPSSGFKSDSEMTKEDIAGLVDACVSKLVDTDSTSTATIKMQVHFGRVYQSYGDIVLAHRDRLNASLRELEQDIIDSMAGSRDECELLYRKIVSSILIRSGVGSATDITVVREATAALESVLPPIELGTFAALSPRQKAKQLRELATIVTGIRLFNKSCGKGGRSIPDLDVTLTDATAKLLGTIRGNHRRFTELATLYAAAVEAAPTDDKWLEPLMNARQYTTYLALLQRDVASIANKVGELNQRQAARVAALKETVQSKAAVPTDQVYPQFTELAEILAELQEAHTFLGNVYQITADLLPFTMTQNTFATANEVEMGAVVVSPHISRVHAGVVLESATLTANALAALGVEDGEPVPPAPATLEDKVLTAADVAASTAANGVVELLTPETTHGYEWLPLHNGGFCVTSAAAEVPLVVPVDREIGVLQYNGRCYGFATVGHMKAFLEEVDTALADVVANASEYPDLIELLQLHEYFATDLRGGLQLGALQGSDAPIMSNSGCQTSTHPVESNIVNGYESNEWELRRKAIHLANLRQKRTHSVQTDNSNFKRETSTQVYLPKTSNTQTRRDGSTSVPKPVTYIKHLRGARGPKAKKAQVVDLTVGIGGLELDIRGLHGSR